VFDSHRGPAQPQSRTIILRLPGDGNPGSGSIRGLAQLPQVEVLDTPGANLEPKVEPKRLFGEGSVQKVIDSEWSRRWDLNPRPADYEEPS